jgi:RNA polymerase sigma factor (sigma-70 family)
MDDLTEDERALAAACIAGDGEARRRLVRRYHRAVHQAIGFMSVVRAGLVQPADVDDAVQQVFLAIFNDEALVLRRWEGRAGLKTYLCRIAERIASRHFRRAVEQRSRFRLALDTPEDDAWSERADEVKADETAEPVDARLTAVEETTRVRAAILDKLTPKGRQFYEYLFVQELDVATIARIEDTNANNVYQWKNRIAKAALEVLEAEGDE